MASGLRNVIVLGGSYVGMSAVRDLVKVLPSTHRVILVEPHSHFHHLFIFPRVAVTPSFEHKAFIPYSAAFSAAKRPEDHKIVRARVQSVQSDRVILDREWQGSNEIRFEYLVIATGTKLHTPGTMKDDDKLSSVHYLQAYQKRVADAKSIILIGGGAVGVQMAADIKELYPQKEVTLVHSRNQLMPLYHEALDKIVKARLQELGVKTTLGSRAVLAPGAGGFPIDDASSFQLINGTKLSADMVILATGQTPNTSFLNPLPASSPTSLINPANGFIRVSPMLQLQDTKYPNIFAVGDVADSGSPKTARAGSRHEGVVTKNILSMIEGKQPQEKLWLEPPGIHITLGLTKNVIFGNPDPARCQTEPYIDQRDDGTIDMDVEGIWKWEGVFVKDPSEYHL